MSVPVRPDPFGAPLTTLRAGVRHRQFSAQAQQTWRHLEWAAGLIAVFLLAGMWKTGFGAFFAAVLGTAAVVAVSRAITAHCSAPRWWRAILALTGLLTWIPGATEVGQVLFVLVAVAFLWLRRYRLYRPLGSRRRALVFTGGVLLLVGIVAGSAPEDASGGFTAVFANVHQSARIFLALFASFTLATLFVHLRLHFLRLRPKLAVAGLLIAAVPVLLLGALAVVGIYGAIGGIRATQARTVLDDWLMIEVDRATELRLFGAGPEVLEDGGALQERIANAVAFRAGAPLPPAFLLRENDRMWAVQVDSVEGGARLASVRRLTSATMARLADEVGCGVQMVGDSEAGVRFSVAGINASSVPVGAGDDALTARPSFAPAADAGDAWYETWVLFGGTTLDAFVLEGSALERQDALLSLQTRAIDLWNTFADGENEVNQVLLAALLALGAAFLLLEALALYFGLRIAGGITHAVGTLHKATQRLAQGDLSATISLPNEDEFGDLADSFNDMTRAIRVAQEQLVQKQRLEQEIATARQIQQRLLPHTMPEFAGYQIAGSSTPSKMVGGDYFDFLPLEGNRLGVAVADVSGKGIPAALLMSNLQASLQGQAIHAGPVSIMVGRMNELLSRSTDDHMFATFFYTVLEGDTGRLVGVNAGHEPALVVRANGSVERLESGGLILGMLPGQTYRECEVTLDPGDVFVLYTDGITEAMGPGTRIPGLEDFAGSESSHAPRTEDDDGDDDEDEEITTNFFEEHRLRDVVVSRRHDSAEAIRRAVLRAVEHHTQDIPQSDDITLVVIKRVGLLA